MVRRGNKTRRLTWKSKNKTHKRATTAAAHARTQEVYGQRKRHRVNKTLVRADNLLFSDNSRASRYASLQATEDLGEPYLRHGCRGAANGEIPGSVFKKHRRPRKAITNPARHIVKQASCVSYAREAAAKKKLTGWSS